MGEQSSLTLGWKNAHWLAATLLLNFMAAAAAVGQSATDQPVAVAVRKLEDGYRDFWLRNMLWHHEFTPEEVHQATGMEVSAVVEYRRTHHLFPTTRPRPKTDRLKVLPYPGGRHPRIGFLEGAIDPQRETKFSVFVPWDESAYVVVDLPEAIWSNLGLTYLAHTHVPTVWSKQGIELPTLEWQRKKDDRLEIERRLPNGITFGAEVVPKEDAVQMHLWLHNGTQQTLSDLRVQTCVMLKGVPGFTAQTNANKIFEKPFVVCRGPGDRWIITAWEPCHRSWGNERCPCLHSDPKFADCPPGETVHAYGWLSFYCGRDVQSELRRIAGRWERGPETGNRMRTPPTAVGGG